MNSMLPLIEKTDLYVCMSMHTNRFRKESHQMWQDLESFSQLSLTTFLHCFDFCDEHELFYNYINIFEVK